MKWIFAFSHRLSPHNASAGGDVGRMWAEDQIPSFSTTASSESPPWRRAAASRRCFIVSDFRRYAVSRSSKFARGQGTGLTSRPRLDTQCPEIGTDCGFSSAFQSGFDRQSLKQYDLASSRSMWSKHMLANCISRACSHEPPLN